MQPNQALAQPQQPTMQAQFAQPTAAPMVMAQQPMMQAQFAQPTLGGPHVVAPPIVDDQPWAQWVFMWGWVLAFIPCASFSTCIGYLVNRVSPDTFIKTRRDRASAAYVTKAAKFGCGCCGLLFTLMIVMQLFVLGGFAGAAHFQSPAGFIGVQGGFLGFVLLFMILACVANVAPCIFGLQMHQNDNELCTSQATGQMESGQIQPGQHQAAFVQAQVPVQPMETQGAGAV